MFVLLEVMHAEWEILFEVDHHLRRTHKGEDSGAPGVGKP